jgi:hypothetical protein
VKEWKMLLICMTIVELFTRRKSKKLEISENKYQQLYNYLQHFNIKTIEIKSSIH